MLNSDNKSFPSESEIKEFWEWCGLNIDHTYIETTGLRMTVCSKCGKGISFKDTLCKSPKLDLNNLFKYAMPKLHSIKLEYDYFGQPQCKVVVAGKEKKYGSGYDPALALFWAIWGVIHGS